MKIVIIGYGWVGQANALSLSLLGEEVYFYDKFEPKFHYAESYLPVYSKIKSLKNPKEVDSPETYYIVCVGDKVLPSGEQDISNIRVALESVSLVKGKIILRSTILPSHLHTLNFDFYVPEFLHEKKAVEECVRPHLFVIGSRKNHAEPEFLKRWAKSALKVYRGTPEEASYIKYLSNIWNSLRIAFVNEFGNAMIVPKNKTQVQSIERVVDFMFGGKSYLRYGKGFGGHCLPKDTLAFSSSVSGSFKTPLLKAIIESNQIHKDLHDENKVVEVWFSEWEKPEVSGSVALQSILKAIKRRLKL